MKSIDDEIGAETGPELASQSGLADARPVTAATPSPSDPTRTSQLDDPPHAADPLRAAAPAPAGAATPSPSDPTRTSQPDGPAASRSHAVPPAMAPQLRDQDRYDILGEHGRGGLGRVSRAHDRELGRDIAIKELISRGHLSEVRFLREALITARLEHPGIVPVYEAGRWPDGTPFYAMKLVSGRPLRDLIAERKTVDERIGLLHHVIAVADAIAYAHGRGIIHRDLKPANVIVGEFGETVVIDWGLAKDLSTADEPASASGSFRTSHDDGLTSAGTILGTPAYMAPEQARGEPVDQRADVFAIGVMLWELCSLHKLPPNFSGQRRRLLREAGIDPDLITIIEKAIDPDPPCRYSDAGALAADLKAFKAGARIAARRYSPWALLVRWARRHRALAASAAALTAIAIAGTSLYVHNIAVERDRTNATLIVAQRELERAQLAEASLLLEKDPTAAKQLLTSLDRNSPQYALLLSRANLGAAERVIHLPARGHKLLYNPSTSAIAAFTIEGALESIDVETGQLHALGDNLLGPITNDGDGWLYARRPFGVSDVTIAGTGRHAPPINAGHRFADVNDVLLRSGQHVYALDKHDLYSLDSGAPALVRHEVRSIAASGDLLMLCTTTNELEVLRDGALEQRTRCASNPSASPMVATATSYAALQDADHLLLSRDGQSLQLPTHISSGYALALSELGVLALADLSDKTWFVRPGSNQLEMGPTHASLPTTVAAVGRLAAWGYADGVVTVIDTASLETWEFKGHGTLVLSLLPVPDHALLISLAGTEIRVWTLAPMSLQKISRVPCTIYNMTPSPDQSRLSFDCHDGNLRVWSLATNSVEEVHHHTKMAFGTAWWGDMPCSAGFDGRVLCTAAGSPTREIFSTTQRIRWLTASPDRKALAIATADGKLWSFDGKLKALYTHDAPPYRMAYSPGGQLLASGSDDGTVIVYEFAHDRVMAKVRVHSERVMSIAWQGDDLWTSSADGLMVHWRFRNNVLIMLECVREAGAFRFLRPFRGGWTGNIDGRMLLVSLGSAGQTLRLDLGQHVEGVELSPDERYIAVTVTGRVTVVDLLRRSIATFPIASDGVGHVGFATPELLAVGMANALYVKPLNQLDYSPYIN